MSRELQETMDKVLSQTNTFPRASSEESLSMKQSGKTPEIRHQMEALDNDIAKLAEVTDMLRSRISSVMRESYPEPGAEETYPESETEMGSFLQSFRFRVQQITEMLSEANDRVQL